jgi:hypothetical protein
MRRGFFNEGKRSMVNTISYDWDSAIVTVKVPTYHTASKDVTEFQLTICQFADLVAGHLKIEDGVIEPCSPTQFVLSHRVADPT